MSKQSTVLKPTVLVTGATGGIGFAAVRALTVAGFEVFAACRKPEDAARLENVGPMVHAIILDVTDSGSIQSAAATLSQRLGSRGLSGLVNNAGILVEGPIELLPVEAIRHQFEVNVFAVVALTKALLPLLRTAHGRVINIGATTAEVAIPMLGAISSSKAALKSISDALRMELQLWDIHVSFLEPGAIQTDIFSKAQKEADSTFATVAEDNVNKRYLQALSNVRKAMEKAGSDKPAVVAEAIVKALTAKNPSPKFVVGKGAGSVVVLRYLPDRVRDKLLISSLGVNA